MFQNRERGFGRWFSKSQTLIIFSVLFLSESVFADKIISCNDGDTCRALVAKTKLKVRLSGIDAPETGQDGAESSRKFLEGLIKNKDVTLKCSGKHGDRQICSIYIGHIDIQKEMVSAGWAFDYPKYSLGKYKTEQNSAKKSRKGLWAIKELTSPYCYRYLGVKKCNEDKLYQP